MERCTVTLKALFEKPREIEVEAGLGGYGGGDLILLNDLLGRVWVRIGLGGQ